MIQGEYPTSFISIRLTPMSDESTNVLILVVVKAPHARRVEDFVVQAAVWASHLGFSPRGQSILYLHFFVTHIELAVIFCIVGTLRYAGGPRNPEEDTAPGSIKFEFMTGEFSNILDRSDAWHGTCTARAVI